MPVGWGAISKDEIRVKRGGWVLRNEKKKLRNQTRHEKRKEKVKYSDIDPPSDGSLTGENYILRGTLSVRITCD